MFKIDINSAVVIADKHGNLSNESIGRYFPDIDKNWDIIKVLPYDKVEFD